MAEVKTVKKKNGLLLFFAIMYLALQGTSVVATTVSVGKLDLSWAVTSCVTALLGFLMFFSYKSHTKNVMKPLLGATLILVLGYEMTNACEYIQLFLQAPAEFAEFFGGRPSAIIYCTANFLVFAAIAGVNIDHYLLNATHASSPRIVMLNKLLYIVYVLMIGVRVVMEITCGMVSSGLDTVSSITGAFADAFVIGMVVIVEFSLDKFRIQREQKEENEL